MRTSAKAGVVGTLLAGLLLLPACGSVPTSQAGEVADGPATSEPAPTVAAPSDPSSSASTSPSTPPSTSTSTSEKPATTAKPAAAKPAYVLAKGAKGEKVRELQVRLRQLAWYAGSISGSYGSGTVKGVKGFQGKRGLKRTGNVDATTWAQLVKRTKTPTHDQKHNVLRPGRAIYRQGSSGDKVRELQARLKQIGWFSGLVTGTYGSATAAGVKGFQAKREIPETGQVDARTWSRLVAMTRTPTDDAKHNRLPKPSSAGLPSACTSVARAICISKSSNSLTWVVGGKAQLRMDVRFGAMRTPTREGTFSILRKERTWTSTIYHSSMPYSMFFSGGQAVHYSSDFAARGYAGASHGCVNVRNLSGLQALFAAARVGDRVYVYR